jgi:hypothetical protein
VPEVFRKFGSISSTPSRWPGGTTTSCCTPASPATSPPGATCSTNAGRSSRRPTRRCRSSRRASFPVPAGHRPQGAPVPRRDPRRERRRGRARARADPRRGPAARAGSHASRNGTGRSAGPQAGRGAGIIALRPADNTVLGAVTGPPAIAMVEGDLADAGPDRQRLQPGPPSRRAGQHRQPDRQTANPPAGWRTAPAARRRRARQRPQGQRQRPASQSRPVGRRPGRRRRQPGRMTTTTTEESPGH